MIYRITTLLIICLSILTFNAFAEQSTAEPANVIAPAKLLKDKEEKGVEAKISAGKSLKKILNKLN